MLGLITTRTKSNVERLKTLSAKGWDNMAESEKAEWLGDSTMSLVSLKNLVPTAAAYTSGVAVTHDIRSMTVTATEDGTQLFGVFIIGEAAEFAERKLTLSIRGTQVTGSATPLASVYWYDDNGYESAGASLSESGSITFTPSENSGDRAYLALFLYVTTSDTASTGDSVRYSGLMLETGAIQHGYVPYTEIHPTKSTMGAYNYTDLNRVEMAVKDLSDRLGLGLTTKSNWNIWDMPSSSEMSRYLSNIQTLRQAYIGEEEIPEAPTTMESFTYNEANNIEKILDAVYEMIGVDRASVLGTMVLGMCTLGQSEEL